MNQRSKRCPTSTGALRHPFRVTGLFEIPHRWRFLALDPRPSLITTVRADDDNHDAPRSELI